MNIYVGNFSFDIMGDDLKSVFDHYGYVKTVKVVRDKFTGESRGFGFVDMPNTNEARAAILGITDIKGRKVVVNEARPQAKIYGSSYNNRDTKRADSSNRKRKNSF